MRISETIFYCPKCEEQFMEDNPGHGQIIECPNCKDMEKSLRERLPMQKLS